MTEIPPQSDWSLDNIGIHVRYRGDHMTPEILKDIIKMVKYVDEMEHVRKTCCPRCRDRELQALAVKYGAQEFDDL